MKTLVKLNVFSLSTPNLVLNPITCVNSLTMANKEILGKLSCCSPQSLSVCHKLSMTINVRFQCIGGPTS